MIERLYIQNFRCLESVTLDFTGRPTALFIGKNGAGKSTVRHALALFQRICRGLDRTSKLVKIGDFSQHLIDRPMRFEIDLVLEGKRMEYAIGFDWPEKFREARILDESLFVDGQIIFKRDKAQVQLPGGAEFGLDWHVFALPVVGYPPGQRAMQSIKTFFASMVLVAPVPAYMTSFSVGPSTELSEDAANLASCLQALIVQKPAAYGAFAAYVKAIMPDFSSIEYVPQGESASQLVVNFKQENGPRSLPLKFDALSDGEKCFFLCAYIIASSAVDSPLMCMWDEPDSHLALSEIGHFIGGLRQTAHKGGQFIATTHHPETIHKFSDETIFVFTRKSHLDPTLPRLLTEFSYNGDLIHALIRDEIIG